MKLSKGAQKYKQEYLHIKNEELANLLDYFVNGDFEDTQENEDKLFALLYAVIGRLHHINDNNKSKAISKKKFNDFNVQIKDQKSQ